MKYDYIIVGQGLAGSVVHYTLEKAGKTALVYTDNEENMSSKVAAGLYNPVTGKRTVKTWMADELFAFLKPFYRGIEEELGVSFLHDKNIYKPFSDVSDQNDISAKSVLGSYKGYVEIDWEGKKFAPFIHCDKGGLEIKQGGYMDTEKFIRHYQERLNKKELLRQEQFDVSQIKKTEQGITYHEHEATAMIFCEGHRAVKNPYFSWLPFALTKGEVLELSIDDFTAERIFNKNGFLFAHEDGYSLAGSTYELDVDKTPSEKGRLKIEDKLKVLLKKNYSINTQRAGIRPTVKDRRPLLGRHPEEKEFYIFNGLGTKGVSLAPYFADKFVKHLTEGSEIPEEVNIHRYFSLYFEAKSAH